MVTCRTLTTDSDSKDSATQTASEDVWKKETSEYLISTAGQPTCGPAVVGRCRFDDRVHGVQQVETAATSTLAHVQQFADVTRERLDDMMLSTSQERQAEWDVVVLRRERVRGGPSAVRRRRVRRGGLIHTRRRRL